MKTHLDACIGGGCSGLVAGCRALLGAVLTFSFGLLCLAVLAFVPVVGFHVGLHGGHTGHCKSICTAGQAHVVVLADVVIEGFVVGGPEGTQWAEIGISTRPLDNCIFTQLRVLGECRSHSPMVMSCQNPSGLEYATSTPFSHWHTSITLSMGKFSESGAGSAWLLS